MASYLILKQNPAQSGPQAWTIATLIAGKAATAEGADAAIVEGFDGPGRYAALRCDNVSTVVVTSEPKLVPEATADFLTPAPEIARRADADAAEPEAEAAEKPVEESVADPDAEVPPG